MSALVKALAAVTLVICLGLNVQPAWAHAKLVGAVPTANSTVATAPKEIALTFNEKIKLITCKVTDKDGKDAPGVDPARADGATLRIPVKAMIPGQYTVSYRIAGDDGHVINASMMFTVEAKP